MTRKLVVGNWKMHGTREKAHALARSIVDALSARAGAVSVGLAPSFAHLEIVRAAVEGSGVLLAAQDVSAEPDGAHTGDVSAAMLSDLGCRFVVVGHSERRLGHEEKDALVARKLEAALAAGLEPILCVGERLDERDRGEHEKTVLRQIDAVLERARTARSALRDGRLVIAYEPVWAIGTGRVAAKGEILPMHRLIRTAIAERVGRETKTTILYGGSVKAENAEPVASIEGVDGALVGGASLDGKAFMAIVRAFEDTHREG